MKKYFSIMVVPHDNAKMRNYRVSYTLVTTFVVLLVVAIISGVVFLGSYGRILYRAHQAGYLAGENRELRARNAQIDSLRTELVRLQTMGIQIKKMMGVGLSVEDSILVANLSPVISSPAIAETAELTEAERSEQRQLLRAVPSLWPLKGYVTREFHTTGGESGPHYHPGMDIAARRNTPVQSAADGVVIQSGWDDTYGQYVLVDHGFGIHTLYGHNARNLATVGEKVARGQTIAFVGSTGKSTAPHLHFEVKKNGIPVDPRNYLLN